MWLFFWIQSSNAGHRRIHCYAKKNETRLIRMLVSRVFGWKFIVWPQTRTIIMWSCFFFGRFSFRSFVASWEQIAKMHYLNCKVQFDKMTIFFHDFFYLSADHSNELISNMSCRYVFMDIIHWTHMTLI